MEQGPLEGKREGSENERRQLLMNLLDSGMQAEQIAAGTKVPVEYVRKLAEEMKN